MERGITRRGRKSKQVSIPISGSEENATTPELVNGGSGKEKILEDVPQVDTGDEPSDNEVMKVKEESPVANNTEPSEFHGFDETPDETPDGASVVNQLVGKYEADLEDEDDSPTKDPKPSAGDAQDEHKVLGQDIYTDSEDESSKETKKAKQVKASSKKRPLEKLEEELNEDEKPTSPPPTKRARKKSAKLREASGESMDNMKLLSDVSSEVTSSGDVSRDNKAKEEFQSEVTSSASQARKSIDTDGVRRGRHSVREITDPIYLKPLELGWRRELVYRGTAPKGPDGRRIGDIYYYTPEGKKVRSRVEILEHLRGNKGLTAEHFCFVKEPIGLEDPNKEVIREASARKNSLNATPVKSEKSPKMTKKGLKGASPAVPDDTSNASNGPSASPPKESGGKTVTPRVVLKSQKPSPKPGPKPKMTPGRKPNTDSPPTKGRVGRPRKEKEVPPAIEGGSESAAATNSWDAGDQPAEQSPATTTGWRSSCVQRQPGPPGRPAAVGATPSEPPAPPQTVATIGGHKFIVVPKHNVLTVSPGPAPAHPQQPAHAQPTVYYVPGANSAAGLPGYSSELLASKRGKLSDNADAIVESSSAGSQGKQGKRQMENFISDISSGYAALFHVMGYLKVQELLRASRVCRMWRDLSLHPNLWHTVRMKNSQVSDWDGFAAAISARGTRVLDLRKMLAPGSSEDIALMWSEFCRVIGKADSLQRVELSRCPASVFEQLAMKCPQLRVINGVAIKSEVIDLEPIQNVPLLEELRLKSNNGMSINKTLDPLLYCRLKHLSLTSVKNFENCNVEIIGELRNLESLELGDCIKLSESFGPDHLTKLTKLQRLRLEKGQVPGCPVISIIESIAKLPSLSQLEIINFDVKPGFDKALAMCKQLKRLLIIPTYITTSASTNHIVLCSLPLLADTLEYLVWGLTLELTRVTDLFIDQCEARKGSQNSNKLKFPGECIPVVKPVLGDEKEKIPENGENSEDKDSTGDKEKEGEQKSEDEDDVETLARDFRTLATMEQQPEANAAPPVRILPIPMLHKLLVHLLPTTKVKILKVPFPSTWRQTFPELSSFDKV